MTQPRSSLLRAIEAEARLRERLRLGDEVRKALIRAEGFDHRTRDGRLRFGLQRALDVMPQPDYSDDGPWTEFVGSVSSAVDGIDVGYYVEDDGEEEDTLPIRMKVHDGGDSTTANVYLSYEDIDQLIELLQAAVAERRRARHPHDDGD